MNLDRQGRTSTTAEMECLQHLTAITTANTQMEEAMAKVKKEEATLILPAVIPSAARASSFDNWSQIRICFTYLPLFISSQTNQTGLMEAMNVYGVNHRLCSIVNINRLKENALKVAEADTRSMSNQFYVLPYKTIDDSKSVDSEENYPTLVPLHYGTTNNTAPVKFAQPLTKEEQIKFKEHLTKCGEYSINNVGDLTKVAGVLLEEEDKEKWIDATNNTDNFYEMYRALRQIYQNKNKYRIGIIDGAHRCALAFNTLLQQDLLETGLVEDKATGWWKYNKVIREKANVNIYNCQTGT